MKQLYYSTIIFYYIFTIILSIFLNTSIILMQCNAKINKYILTTLYQDAQLACGFPQMFNLATKILSDIILDCIILIFFFFFIISELDF